MLLETQSWTGYFIYYPAWIPWIIFAGMLIVVVACSIIGTFAFKDSKEKSSNPIPTFVTIFGLVSVMFCIIIIPIDIFNVSHIENPFIPQIIVFSIHYLGSYVVLLIFAFILIPFAYFFYEEGDEEIPLRSRCFGALKYTLFTIFLGILVLIFILVMRLIDLKPPNNAEGWIKTLVDYEGFGSQALGWVGACLAIIGLLPWNFYTGMGLALLPVGLMKPKKKINLEMGTITEDIDMSNEKMRTIKAKYSLSGNKMSAQDEKEYRELKRKAKVLSQKNKKLNEISNSWGERCEPFIYPIKLALGLLFFAISLFIIISLFLTSLNRAIFSKCHFFCGFLTLENTIPNPLDLLLTYSSILFPLDIIFFVLFIVVILLASVTGLTSFGINFLCIHLYKIKWRNTVPQGLLTGCIFLMFICVVFSFSMLSFAPQYASFGSQRYQDYDTGNWVLCNYKSFTNSTRNVNSTLFEGALAINRTQTPCVQTELASLLNSVGVRAGFMSSIFFIANWIFILSFGVGILVGLWKEPLSFAPEITEDYEQLE